MIAWQRDLETASTPGEVVQLARCFLAALSDSQLAALPDGCRAENIVSTDDIQACSRRLTEVYWARRGTGGQGGAIEEAWSFFLRAATQVARMLEAKALS